MKILSILFLIVLFLTLSKSADLIVVNLRKIGEKLGIKIFVLGIILGIMTNLPEMAVGFNSVINDIPEMSFGNLVGGIIVIFSLILGLSIVLNKKIKTEKKSWPFLLTLIVLLAPLALAYKGGLSEIDGIIMILLYFLMIYILYQNNKQAKSRKLKLISPKEIINHTFLILIGIVLLIISSNLTVKTTIFILKDYNISPFIVGLLLYSVGTNLPEISIAIRSYKRKMEDLSFSNLIGSALGNVLTLGVLTFVKPINIAIDYSFLFLSLTSFSLFVLLYIFYRTDHFLSRAEGLGLLAVYVIFIIGQLSMQI